MVERKSILRLTAIVVLLFAMVALTMDALFTQFIISEKDIANQNKIRRLVGSTESGEIPIFGSSKARSSFIPEMIHPNAYNYGMERSNFDMVELMLEIELEKERKTPIILEFNHRWFVHRPAHTINASDLVPNRDIPVIREFMQRYDRDDVRYRIPGVRYYGSYIYYGRYYLKKSIGTKKRVSKGGVFSDLNPKEEVFDNYVKAWTNRNKLRHELIRRRDDVREVFSAVDKRHLKGLDEYLLFTADSARIARFEQLVSENPDRKFILAYTPHHSCELEGIENQDLMNAFFTKWQASFSNLVVLDDSRMDLSDANFKNSTHLNLRGAEVYSSYFGTSYTEHLRSK